MQFESCKMSIENEINMLPVIDCVETHANNQAAVVEQNMEIDQLIDEDLNVCPTSERVSLHENAVEASEEQSIEIDPINGDIIVRYPHFVDFHPNGSTWVVKARLVRMVEVFNQLLPHATMILVLLDDQVI
ncbi:hypothetical protein RHSIM_Rhsim11G0009200 [Rhododendron simsii]|uniref:Uncharacterized protein n=1 Tax=Rhododendron simsii TaxID=118357 RepID=A0A834G825_RHOSS|nr:hypothetical protein RHSIM_Rhsim11G0009200 [Rhododendron simsii]